MDPVTGTLIGAGVSAVGTGASIAANANLNKKNREWQSQEAQYNRDFQMQMYERQLSDNIDWRTHQEVYNSPEAMMKRYVDAGINPMMVVSGSGGNMITTPMSINGVSGSTAPSASTHRYDVDTAGVMSALRLMNETKVSNSQNDVLQAEALKIRKQAEGIEMDNIRKEIESGYWASNAYQTARSLIKANQLNDSQRYLLQKQGELIDAKMPLIQEQINLHKAQVASTLASVRHQLWYTEFMQSLAPYERQKLEYEVSLFEQNLDIAKFANKMKEISYWLDFGTQIVGSITQVIGGIKGLSFAPLNTVNHSFNKKVGNEIQSPESMMGTYDINY